MGLQSSVANEEAPICPTCSIAMRWFRSELLRDCLTAHLYICPDCECAAQTQTKLRSAQVPRSDGGEPKR